MEQIGTLQDRWAISGETYDANFNFLDTTSIPEIGSMTGIDYSAVLDQIIVGDGNTGIIRFVNLDGTITGQVSTGHGSIRGLDFDDRDSSIWFALDNRIQHWSSTGDLLFSFDADASLPPPSRSGWTGVAIDMSTDRMFAIAEDNDSIHEFLFDGTYLGKLLDDPFTEGDARERNGLGLHFDESTGLLRIVNQKGGLLTYAVVPEPGTLALTALGLWGIGWRRRKRA